MKVIFFLAVTMPLASAWWNCPTEVNNPTCNADTEVLCPGGTSPVGCALDGSCVPKLSTWQKDNDGNWCPAMCPPGCDLAGGEMLCPPRVADNGCLESATCVRAFADCKNWFG